MIVITGANGKLGRHVIDALLTRVAASQIIAAVRNPAAVPELEALGITLRQADYSQPATLITAFAGAEKLLLISSNDLEHRISQHQNVIDAAVTAGVKLLAYTSLIAADTSTLGLARDHVATESAIRASGLAYSFLRNDWYLENHTENLGPALAHGAILGAAGSGRFSAASRADYAAAAAAVLTASAPRQIYELAGDHAYTLADLAAEVQKQSRKPIHYQDLPQSAFADALKGFGLPAPVAEMLADSDAAASRGALESESRDLSELIGRPTTPLAEAVAAALNS